MIFLESCLFCGNAILEMVATQAGGYDVDYYDIYYIECNNCSTRGPENGTSMEEAVEDWNTRNVKNIEK